MFVTVFSSMRSSVTRGRVICLFALAVLLLSSCSSRKAPEEEKKFEIDKVTTLGPLTVHVRVSKGEISLADELDLDIEASIEEGYRTELPRFGEKLEQFGIRDYRDFPPKLSSDGRVISRKLYRLEPFLSGDYKIPVMTVKFYKETSPAKKEEGGDTAEEKEYQLETEEIPIKVTSLVGDDRENLQLRGLKDVVSLPPSGKLFLYLGLAAVSVAAVVALLILLHRRRRRKEETPRLVPAHETAYEQLRKLGEKNLIESGRVKEFYIGISDILRHYIENRFSLRAPERTTEEFLVELAASNELDRKHKELLQDFLQHCDMVKFARYRPETKEIQGTFDAARRFIKETAL